MTKKAAPDWNELCSKPDLTAKCVVDQTVHQGMTIEELLAFLEMKFPGILPEFAEVYLDAVTAILPSSNVPTKREVDRLISCAGLMRRDPLIARLEIVNHYHDSVNANSPGFAKNMMAATIDLCFRNYAASTIFAGFAVCEFKVPRFVLMFTGNQNDAKEAILASERHKAEVLVQLILKRRSR